jgi:hypothetical protein
MSREEEILNASTAYHEEQFHCDGWNYDFIEGAKLFDQHPRKWLWDGNRVIAWLKENIGEYYMTNEFEEYFDSMYEDLKKATED